MIICLGGKQWNSVSNRIPAPWREAMKENRTKTYGMSYNYDLPAICWRRLFDHLAPQATGPMGGFTQGPDALYSAISKIIREVMTIEQHPGLKPGLHVTGWRGEVIPAWETRPTRSCYPAEAEFVLLFPRHVREREWKLTVWLPTNDHVYQAESLLHHQQMEAIFVTEVSAGAVELRRVPQD